jgi:hypothetical protein
MTSKDSPLHLPGLSCVTGEDVDAALRRRVTFVYQGSNPQPWKDSLSWDGISRSQSTSGSVPFLKDFTGARRGVPSYVSHKPQFHTPPAHLLKRRGFRREPKWPAAVFPRVLVSGGTSFLLLYSPQLVGTSTFPPCGDIPSPWTPRGAGSFLCPPIPELPCPPLFILSNPLELLCLLC